MFSYTIKIHFQTIMKSRILIIQFIPTVMAEARKFTEKRIPS